MAQITGLCNMEYAGMFFIIDLSEILKICTNLMPTETFITILCNLVIVFCSIDQNI